jgi:hypothetical protein
LISAREWPVSAREWLISAREWPVSAREWLISARELPISQREFAQYEPVFILETSALQKKRRLLKKGA